MPSMAEIGSVRPLAAGETRVLREGVSKGGRTVRLSLSVNQYEGAQPYYTVAYLKASGDPQYARYTPFLDRAGWLFDQFMADITDPAKLASGNPTYKSGSINR